MNAFDQKFIENPVFLTWIFNSNPAIEQYWEQYLLDHPQEKSRILELKHLLSDLKFSNDTLNPFEKRDLANRLMMKINSDVKQDTRRHLFYSFLKYAAVALVFTAIGGLLVYLNLSKESFYQQMVSPMANIPSVTQGPILITSNGKNVNLKKSNSTVDYSANGAIVLNNDSVIQSSDESANALNQVVTPYGTQLRMVLSDNTVVWLNSGSQLVYPKLFKDKTREVLLFGEAFFEVSKNPDKPFIVKTSDLDIKVLGTEFNVSAYGEDNEIQTVLKEGSVAIRRKGAGFFEKDVMIKPNQLASFSKATNNTKVSQVDVDYYTLWLKGLMSFDEIDFIRVIKKVERFYNISIDFADHQKEIMRISGKLDLKRGKQEVMEYLSKVSLSTFEQTNENQYIIR